MNTIKSFANHLLSSYKFLSIIILAFIIILPLDKLIFLSYKLLNVSFNPSEVFYFKLNLMKFNFIICLLVLLFKNNYLKIVNLFILIKREVKPAILLGFIPVYIIFLFHSFLVLRDLLDLEKILYEKISGNRFFSQRVILPNGGEAADFYPPKDFTLFINTVIREIPPDAKILYLGVERDIANYFLYPRKLYKPPEYEWLFLSKENLIKKDWLKDKNIDFIIRKYRPIGFKIEKLKK